MRKHTLSVLAGALVLTALAGCSSSAQTYKDLDAVVNAYVKAGGDCTLDQPVDDGMAGAGIHQMMCSGQPLVMVSQFDNEAAKAKLVKSYITEGGYQALVGPNWMISGEDLGKYKEKLGGEIQGGKD